MLGIHYTCCYNKPILTTTKSQSPNATIHLTSVLQIK